MAVTIELPKELQRQAEEFAARRGTSVEQLLIVALARELATAAPLAESPYVASGTPGAPTLANADIGEIFAMEEADHHLRLRARAERRVTPPLFPATETGPIRSLTNEEIDAILDRDEHPGLFRDDPVTP